MNSIYGSGYIIDGSGSKNKSSSYNEAEERLGRTQDKDSRPCYVSGANGENVY